MAEPWPVTSQRIFGDQVWFVGDSVSITEWRNEKDARRYAALPVLLDLARQVGAYHPRELLEQPVMPKHLLEAARAALKAAGEEIK